MGFAVACIYGLMFTSQTPPIHDRALNLSPKRDVAAIVVGPILATNVLSTSLIAWKAWYVVSLLATVLVWPYDEYPLIPGITTEQWVRISERVGLLGTWRESSCF
jgi:hypothetical protein